MATWKYHLKIRTEWHACKDGELPLKKLIEIVVRKIKALGIEDDYKLDNIVEELESLGNEDNPDTDEFDCIWLNLYDWSDQSISDLAGKDKGFMRQKTCWIETII